MGSMFSAYAITRIIDLIRLIRPWVLRIPFFVIPLCLIIFLTLSGIVDLMPIKNDGTMDLPDIKANKDAQWFLEHTPPDAVVLNINLFNHPASIAGRKIFLGWPYFAWSAGYDTNARHDLIVKMVSYPSQNPLCEMLTQSGITHIALEDTHGDPNLPSVDFSYYESHFKPVYTSDINNFMVFETNDICAR
jgi:hypothetical protein